MLSNSHNGLQHTQWLVENLEEVDQSVKAMLNLLKDGGLNETSDNKLELIAHVEVFHRMYRSLAEKYGHLTEVVNTQTQTKAVSYSPSTQDSLLVTPNPKLSLNKSENQTIGFSLSSSSDFSDKGNSEISSSTSDSESEAFYSVANKTSEFRLNLQENEAYSTLLRRVSKYEEELKNSKTKLCVSDEEIGKLKGELELAQRVIAIRNGELETEKLVVSKLEREVAECQSLIETEKRTVLELKEKILGHEADAHELDLEIKKLNISLFDSQRMFSLENAKLECDISIMSEQLTLLKARIGDFEMRNKFLETEIRQYEAEKVKMESIYKDQLICSCGEIEKLKADISERVELVEALNKDFDSLKVKYDMLVAEKDELNAKIQTLEAQKSSQSDLVRNLGEKINKLAIDYMDLSDESVRKNKLVLELSEKVEELEREMERQRDENLERCEEKREAIRQLCIYIDHYRNDYQELETAIAGRRHGVVLAS